MNLLLLLVFSCRSQTHRMKSFENLVFLCLHAVSEYITIAVDQKKNADHLAQG